MDNSTSQPEGYMQLRQYQSQAIEAIFHYLANRQGSPCVVLPTGAGKSIVIAAIAERIVGWGGRVLVLAHVHELLEQLAEKMPTLDVGIYSAGLNRRDTKNQIIIAGIQSVYQRAPELCGCDPFSLVLVDEAHRIPLDGDGMYRTLIDELKRQNPKTRIAGLTATPYRTGAGYVCGPDNILTEICYEVGVRDLIDQGFLCPLTSKKSNTEVDMTGVEKRGDYNASQMEERYNTSENVSSAVNELLAYTADRKKVLVFCCGIAHAVAVAEQIESQSPGQVRIVSSNHDGRSGAIEAFKAGKCKYLVNINCLTEGFDEPAIDCVALLRSTLSPGLMYQMIGRGLRRSPEKQNCLILDFGTNIKRLGTIDNLKIGKGGKRSEDGEAPVKTCQKCQELVHAAATECTACGEPFPEREPNHDERASDDAPLSVESISQVDQVFYRVHEKRGADKDTPKTLRVTYYCTDVMAEEWICIEHGGYARQKAEAWWYRRTFEPMPETAEEAMAIANAGLLLEPEAIKTKPDGDYTRITGYKLPELVQSTEDVELPF